MPTNQQPIIINTNNNNYNQPTNNQLNCTANPQLSIQRFTHTHADFQWITQPCQRP